MIEELLVGLLSSLFMPLIAAKLSFRESKPSRRPHDNRVCGTRGSWGVRHDKQRKPMTHDTTAWYPPHQDLGRNGFGDLSRFRVGAVIFLCLVFFAEILNWRLGLRQRSFFGSRARQVENQPALQ